MGRNQRQLQSCWEGVEAAVGCLRGLVVGVLLILAELTMCSSLAVLTETAKAPPGSIAVGKAS